MPDISDHDIVFIEFNITPCKVKQVPRNIPLHSKANWDTIKTEINNLNTKLHEIAHTTSANDLWNTFKTNLNELVNKHIPHKKLSSKPRTPWVTNKTKTLIKKETNYKKRRKVTTKT